jgi:hypothetical protein
MTENKKKGKTEKTPQELTRAIIKGVKILHSIKVTFLSVSSDASSNSDLSNGDAWISGHALKTSKDGEWLVVSSVVELPTT